MKSLITNQEAKFLSFLKVIALLFIFFHNPSVSHSQDLPPAVTNIQSISAGSYIIPMNEDKQSILQTDQFTGIAFTGFNKRAYGLIYRLLNNGVPVKWVIRAGKTKDGVDFSAMASKKFPVQENSSFHGFSSGAFVIDIDDVYSETCNENSGSFAFVDNLITGFGGSVAVYVLDENTSMDVRYNLTSPPKIAILNDGGWADAHFRLLTTASIPYTTISSQQFFQDYSCYTFISQPHLETIVNPNYIPSLNNFLLSGGNFLAQCSAVEVFEDAGLYITDTGLSANWGNCGENISYNYFYPDMPLMQFEGALPRDIFGTISSFIPEAGGSYNPNSYIGLNNQSGRQIVVGADVNGPIPGGNMFFLGGHEFTSQFVGFCEMLPPNPVTIQRINQLQRIYFNTLFIPSSVSFACAGNDACVCPGNSVTLGCENVVQNPGTTFSWTPTTGLSCSDCPNPIANPTTTTTYSLTVSSALGSSCTEPSTVTVTVLSPITIENVATVCDQEDENYSVSFTIEGGNQANYVVSGLPGTLSGNVFVSDPIPSGEPYLFEVNGPSTCFDSIEGIHNCCAAEGEITGGGDICINDPQSVPLFFEFQGEAPWTFTYALDGVDQASIFTNEPVYIMETTEIGIYTITSVEDAICFGNGSGSVEVYSVESPLPVDLGPELSFCRGESYTLSSNQSLVEYQWQDGSTDPQYTVDEPGLYSLTVTNACGSESGFVFIDVVSPPLAFNLGNDTVICRGEELPFILNIDNVDYLWQDGSTNPYFIAREAGIYALTVSNDCGSQSDAFSLDFFNCLNCLVAVPNAITPNYDGINDSFFPDHYQCDFLDYSLTVFDRWGELLYETTDPDAKWDAHFRGKMMPMGVYVWLLRYSYSFRGEIIHEQKAGDLTIIR